MARVSLHVSWCYENLVQPHIKNHVLIINAEDIFTKGQAQNVLSEKQSDDLYSIYQTYEQKGPIEKDIEGIARWVCFEEIEDNDFNLNIARYVQKPLKRRNHNSRNCIKGFPKKNE